MYSLTLFVTGLDGCSPSSLIASNLQLDSRMGVRLWDCAGGSDDAYSWSWQLPAVQLKRI
jgi:hypothetical protein